MLRYIIFVCLAFSLPALAQEEVPSPEPVVPVPTVEPVIVEDTRLPSLQRPPAIIGGTPPPAPAASPPAPPDNTTNKPEPEIATPEPGPASLSIGAGVVLWYYQPLLDGVKNKFETFYARLTIDGKRGIWGVHLEPRFRDTKQRGFEDGPVFLQEAYVSAAPGPFTIKVGKSYSMLGLFWDNSFYGNVQVYDGLKLSPDYGVSIAGNHKLGDVFKLGYTLQYFVIDGRTNVSLANRDILSVPEARRRNALVARIDPELDFGGTNSLRFGVSGQLFEADLPVADPTVLRAAVDAKLTYNGFGLWGEYLFQHGRHVTDYPLAGTPAAPGRASDRNHYALLGGEYSYSFLVARFNFSYVNYTQRDVSETFYVPALGFKPIGELLLLAEYVHWRRHDPGDVNSFVDRSLNVTAQGFF
ncbi:MAG: hypothetical protein ABW352_06710 [Polyangiales bacterium]